MPKVAGTMDLEPIYCAEQIQVPPELAGILKAYTKEVVRRQPEDIHEFSAIYFSNLASVSASTRGDGAAHDGAVEGGVRVAREI